MAKDRRRPATMRDVAERAGVSRSLVSTVFRDVPGASPATRERVLRAAADLGYRPDVRAQQLRSHGNTLIGVTLTATQPFHVSFVEALHDDLLLDRLDLGNAVGASLMGTVIVVSFSRELASHTSAAAPSGIRGAAGTEGPRPDRSPP